VRIGYEQRKHVRQTGMLTLMVKEKEFFCHTNGKYRLGFDASAAGYDLFLMTLKIVFDFALFIINNVYFIDCSDCFESLKIFAKVPAYASVVTQGMINTKYIFAFCVNNYLDTKLSLAFSSSSSLRPLLHSCFHRGGI
jgi:hypothetical protein